MSHEILFRKFQNIKLIELTGGYTNSTFLLEGTDPPVIAKISTNNSIDARVEINCLTLLNEARISPGIHDYFEDNGFLYIILDYLKGVNSQKYLDENDNVKAQEIFKLLGKHLAQDVHSIQRRESNSNIPILKLINIDIDSIDFMPIVLKDKVKLLLNIDIEEEETLVHGDYGPHNAISIDDTLYIIDWEWAGWGHPLQDIAWVIWFVHLHYPMFAKDLSWIFISEYSSYSNVQINEELLKAFSISRILNIMNRIKNGNMDVKNEWVRRLEWTLQTNFLK